jgi:hypothetical protein
LQVSCGNPPAASATQGHGKHPAIASRLGFVFQQCLSALNQIPNKKLCDGSTTYKLAFEIEDLFRGEAVQSTEMAAVGAEVGEEIEEEEEFEMRM